MRCSVDDQGRLALTFEPRQGHYRPWWREIEILVHGRAGAEPIRVHDMPKGGTVRL